MIEAVPENLELKRQVFAEIDRLSPPAAILASNTSELSISLLAEATGSAHRVIGTHWFYPAHVMKLIEVVKGQNTSEKTLEVTSYTAESLLNALSLLRFPASVLTLKFTRMFS